MKNFLKGMKANYSVSAIVCVVLGVVLIVWPQTALQVVYTVLGSILALYGVIQVLIFLFSKEKTMIAQGMLLFGIILVVVGAWIILKPEGIIVLIPIIIGAFIVLHGLHNVYEAIQLHTSGYDKWWLALVFGLLTIGIGVLLICNPFGAVESLVRMIGIFLVYDGISNMWILSRMFKFRKEPDKIVDAEVISEEDVED